MNILDTLLDTLFGRPGSYGHWDNSSIFGQLHSRSMPQVGCRVCEQLGWIPATTPTATDPDSATARLALAAEDIGRGIANLELAIKDDSQLDEALGLELDTLRGVQAAIAQEMEATP